MWFLDLSFLAGCGDFIDQFIGAWRLALGAWCSKSAHCMLNAYVLICQLSGFHSAFNLSEPSCVLTCVGPLPGSGWLWEYGWRPAAAGVPWRRQVPASHKYQVCSQDFSRDFSIVCPSSGLVPSSMYC